MAVALALAAGAVTGVLLPASPAHAATPTLAFVRNIETHPFVGTSTSIKDNEDLVYVPANNVFWVVDDSTGQAYEVNKDTGHLGHVITKSNFANAHKYHGTELAGSSRAPDMEAVAYDVPSDTLYIFSGTCCTSSVKATVFRLTRPSTSAAFAIDSWQSLVPNSTDYPYSYTDFSGAAVRNGEIWASGTKTLVHYDYVTNTATSPSTISGISSIYGVKFGPSSNDMWLSYSGDHIKKFDFATKTAVPGYDFAMSSYGVKDARGMEQVGSQLFVSDGYDYYGSVSTAWSVRVFNLNTGAAVTPVASFSKSTSTGAAPLAVDFTDTSTNVPTSWSWNFGDGTALVTAQTASHTYASPGTYNVTLKATNSAGSDTAAAQPVTVSPAVPPAPVASFTKSASSGAAPLTVTFTDTSTNTPTSWSWNFGDGTPPVTTQNPSHTFTAGGPYSVVLTATNAGGTSSSPSQSVTVAAAPVAPVASFTKSASSGAAPLTVNFTDTSTNTPTSWLWDFGDGATSTVRNPSHVFAQGGPYSVTLQATNTVGNNTSPAQSVTATLGSPVASFTKSASSGTAPLTVDFTDTSTNSPASWSWNFGDGSPSVTTQNPSHTFAAGGPYSVVLTAANANGSGTSSSQTVTATAAPVTPVPSFTTNLTTGPAPLTVKFTDTSTNTPTSWSWDFGDGTAVVTTQNPTHVFTTAGTYDVTLLAGNAAGSATTSATTITVTPPLPPNAPVASFTKSAASGSAPLTVNFTDTSTNTPTSWSWDFGDGTLPVTTQNPSHVFSAAGSYNVVLTATNAGGSGVSGPQSVTVSTSAPTTLTLLPNDASYVDSSNPTAVHATTGQLYNQVGAATLRSYLKFNVGGVTGTVTSAKLRLWVTDGTVDGAAWYRITSNSWSQATNTWANAPAVDGVKVGDPGLVPELAWLEIDVTAVVTGNGVYSFATLPTSPDAEKYSAKLDSTRPQLVITTA